MAPDVGAEKCPRKGMVERRMDTVQDRLIVFFAQAYVDTPECQTHTPSWEVRAESSHSIDDAGFQSLAHC